MSLPYMPYYVQQYEADTMHLTLEEDGVYMRLLRLCWRTPRCSIPNDVVWIRRQMRVNQKTFDAVVLPILDEFFKQRSGRYYSPKLTEVFAKANELSRKRSDAGKKGGRPRKPPETKDKGKSKAEAKGKLGQSTKDKDKNKVKTIQKDFDLFWASYPRCKRKTDKPKAFLAFEAIVEGKHKVIKAPNTSDIISGIKSYAQSGPDPEYIPLPTTWLNGERWNDDYSMQSSGQSSQVDMYRNMK